MIFNSENVQNVRNMIKNQSQKYMNRFENYKSQGYNGYMMNKKAG